jgi:NADH:ubiquinone oxidoreductase subunit 6 (subunit J)
LDTFFYVLLALVLVGCAVASLLFRSLVRAAVALGMGSVALALMLFTLGAPYAGGFELSVGAGLTGVLFVIGISLTESLGSRRHED